MKRLSIIALFGLLMATTSMAQTNVPRYYTPQGASASAPQKAVGSHTMSSSVFNGYDGYLGLRIGPSLSHINNKMNNIDTEGTRTGFSMGVVAGFGLSSSSDFYIEPGLYFISKGGCSSHDNQDVVCKLNYLEVPVVVKYIIDLENDFTIQPFAGVYGSLGVGGRIKDYNNRASKSSFAKDEYQREDGTYVQTGFSRLDGGIRAGIGFSYDLFYVEAAADFGLANVSHDEFETARTFCLQISAGVNF